MTVDRQDFIPEQIWPFNTDTDTYDMAVNRATDPDGWERAVSAAVPLVTQWDDGALALTTAVLCGRLRRAIAQGTAQGSA